MYRVTGWLIISQFVKGVGPVKVGPCLWLVRLINSPIWPIRCGVTPSKVVVIPLYKLKVGKGFLCLFNVNQENIWSISLHSVEANYWFVWPRVTKSVVCFIVGFFFLNKMHWRTTTHFLNLAHIRLLKNINIGVFVLFNLSNWSQSIQIGLNVFIFNGWSLAIESQCSLCYRINTSKEAGFYAIWFIWYTWITYLQWYTFHTKIKPNGYCEMLSHTVGNLCTVEVMS